MSGWDIVKGAGLVGVIVWGVAGIAGPFRLDDEDRLELSSRRTRVWAWVKSWPRRPRDPLTLNDWVPHGFFFLPAMVSAGLVYGGTWVLFGRGQTFRLGGLLALAVGLPMLIMIIGYFFRPGYPEVGDGSGSAPPFPSRTKGYLTSDVDAFFATIEDRTPGEITNVIWDVASPGYDMEAVDDALQRWKDWRSGTGPDPHHGRHRRPPDGSGSHRTENQEPRLPW